MTDTRLEGVLAQFEDQAQKLSSADDARRVLQAFNRAAGFSGRSDSKAVPMINGAVISAAIWQEYRPRFEKLREQLTQVVAQFARNAKAELESRRKATLRFFFDAHLEDPDSGERIDDPELVKLCDGKNDNTGLETSANFADTPVLRLPIQAVIRYDGQSNALRVVMELALERQPSDDEVKRIGGVVYNSMFSGWGLNHDFDLPDELADHVLHFEPQPSRWESAPYNQEK